MLQSFQVLIRKVILVDFLKKKLEEFIYEHQLNEYESKTLIDYRQAINIFIEFADLLERYKEEILLSFTELPHKKDEDGRRISNGPIEGFNRKPKDFKRNSRGVDNYAYTKNRLLWATRQNEPVLAVPKSEQEIHNYTGIKRGIYNKKI